MPINKYYGGHGDEVMSNMTKEYGDKKGKSVFYATANKRGAKPMAYGGLAVPDDPYAGFEPYTQPPDEEKRRQQILGSMPGPPPVPSNIPAPPPMAATPPPDPDVSIATGGSLGTGGKDPAVKTAQATPAPVPVVDSQTQQNPSGDQPPPVPSREPLTQEDQAPGGESSMPPPVPGKYSVGPEQSFGPPPVPGTAPQFGENKVKTNATQEALDYAKQMLMDPKHPDQYKKPAMWQNILGGVLGATRFRNVDLHPNLTRQYRNLGILDTRAKLEREAQVAQATEEEKKAAIVAHQATARGAGLTQWDTGKSLIQRNADGTLSILYEGKPHPSTIEAAILQAQGSDAPNKAQVIDELVKLKGKLSTAATAALGPMTEEEHAALRKRAATEPSLDYDAWTYGLTGKLNTKGGLGAGSSQSQVRDIKTRLSQIMNDMGLTAGDLFSRGAELKSNIQALSKVSQTSAQMQIFEDTLIANSELARQLSERVKRGDVGIYNRVILALRGETGDQDAKNLAGQIHTMAAEWAKILTGATGAAATPQDEARAVERIISGGLSNAQLGSFIDTVIIPDAQNRTAANDKEKNALLAHIKGTTEALKPAAAPTPKPAPGGGAAAAVAAAASAPTTAASTPPAAPVNLPPQPVTPPGTAGVSLPAQPIAAPGTTGTRRVQPPVPNNAFPPGYKEGAWYDYNPATGNYEKRKGQR